MNIFFCIYTDRFAFSLKFSFSRCRIIITEQNNVRSCANGVYSIREN